MDDNKNTAGIGGGMPGNINVTTPAPGPQPSQTGPLPSSEFKKDEDETPKEKRMVQVDAETLEKLVAGYEKMEQKVEDLTKAADVGRLARIEQLRNQGKLVKSAKVSVYSGKVVLAWVSVKDDIFFDDQGRLHEDQQVELILDGGLDDNGKIITERTKPMSYREFARLITKADCEVVRESKDKDGVTFFTLLHSSGREYELPISFIN